MNPLKHLDVKTNRTLFLCRHCNGHHNTEPQNVKTHNSPTQKPKTNKQYGPYPCTDSKSPDCSHISSDLYTLHSSFVLSLFL